MNEMNKWFYSLTLNELYDYITKLESENEKLIRELKTASKLNCILENVAKSTQTGYSLLRRIEINKSCECNEHLNSGLRKTLNESINQTNVLLNNLQQLHNSCDDIDGNTTPRPLTIDEEEMDLSADKSKSSANSMTIRHSITEKELTLSSPLLSSGYESNDYTIERPNRVTNLVFKDNFKSKTTESYSPKSSTAEDMPQNLSNHKSQSLVQSSVKPIPDNSSKSQISNLSLSYTGAATVENTMHLPNKCTECDLSFSLKPSLDQHMLTHVKISPTFTFQRAGRGRPSKNDSRILRVTDSDINILRMNEALGGLPSNMISLSALEELRRKSIAGFGRYRCPWPECGYTPHFLRDLRRHMFKHTGDKKYKCDLDGCDFITVWKTSLLQHQRKKHCIGDQTQTIQVNKNI